MSDMRRIKSPYTHTIMYASYKIQRVGTFQMTRRRFAEHPKSGSGERSLKNRVNIWIDTQSQQPPRQSERLTLNDLGLYTDFWTTACTEPTSPRPAAEYSADRVYVAPSCRSIKYRRTVPITSLRKPDHSPPNPSFRRRRRTRASTAEAVPAARRRTSPTICWCGRAPSTNWRKPIATLSCCDVAIVWWWSFRVRRRRPDERMTNSTNIRRPA